MSDETYNNLLVSKTVIGNIIVSESVPDGEVWMIQSKPSDFGPRLVGKIVNVKINDPQPSQAPRQTEPGDPDPEEPDDMPSS